MDFNEDETILSVSNCNEDSGLDNGTLSDSSLTSMEGFQNNVENNESANETQTLMSKCYKFTYNISGLDIQTMSGRTFSYMASYIKEVNLSKNKISGLPETLGTLKNLEVLDLSGNILSELPESMKYLGKLKLLNISCNKFTKLPLCLEHGMAFITTLDLSDNKIETLPTEPFCLPRLQCLKIKNNNLLVIPMWLFGDKCRSLIELDVSFNFCFDSKRLNSEIQLAKHHRSSVLKVLKVFNVFNTGVNKERLSYLEDFELLEVLYMGNTGGKSESFNFFSEVPVELFYDPSTVQKLIMPNVGIVSIPNNVTKLTHLKVLNLAENVQLQWLPDSFGQLNTLEELVLSKCGVTFLPANFNQLSNLKKLLLDHNKLTEVSRHLEGLKSLEWLDLYDNFLEEFPLSVEYMSTLKKLDVSFNHFDPRTNLGQKPTGVHFSQLYIQLEEYLRSSHKVYSKRTNNTKALSNVHYDSEGSSDSAFSRHHHFASLDSYSSQDEEENYEDTSGGAAAPIIQDKEEEWDVSGCYVVDLDSIKRLPQKDVEPVGFKPFGWKPPLYKNTYGYPECTVPMSQRFTGFIFVPGDNHLKPRGRRRDVQGLPTVEEQFDDAVMISSSHTCSSDIPQDRSSGCGAGTATSEKTAGTPECGSGSSTEPSRKL